MATFILDQAESLANSNAELRPRLRSVTKEIIHHHILRAMNDSGLLQSLTFIGGTCLRLCHGGIRFSEDLDFRGGGQDFESLNEAMSRVLEPALLKRGLKATVRQAGQSSAARLKPVRRWWVRVQIRDEQQRGAFSVERIKLDIDSRPKPARPLTIRPRPGTGRRSRGSARRWPMTKCASCPARGGACSMGGAIIPTRGFARTPKPSPTATRRRGRALGDALTTR